MNKYINFEDTIYILNFRIRMVKNLLHLDIDPGAFFNQTMSDMDFISTVLDTMTEKFLANQKFLDCEIEADNILDAEWQFSQLISEISNNSSSFSKVRFPEIQTWIAKFKENSLKRKKQIEESYVPPEQTAVEPVVSHAELNGLLGSA